MTKVLIVDDDEAYVTLATSFLLSKGYEVICASNGPGCLESLDKDPDLILLDIMMPGMDGKEILNHIKEIDPNVKVAFLTVLDKDFDPAEIGAVDYIEKKRKFVEKLNL